MREKPVPMTNEEALIKTCGECRFEGRHYVMIGKLLPFADKDVPPRYQVNAICMDDETDEHGYRPVYTLTFPMTDEDQIAYYEALMARDQEKAMAIQMETGLDPEAVFCDRNQPSSIAETMFVFNLDELRQLNNWDM